jgi:sec-independent protein translocase protein TatA
MVPQLALPEGGEWIVILIIVVLLFGAKKLPELTKNAARAMNEFNKARNEDDKPPVEAGPEKSADLGRGAEGVGEDRRGL